MSTQPSRARLGNGRILAAAIAAALAATYAAPALAVPIQTDNWSGSWDTTLSYGSTWRVQSPDCRIIANANGGCGRSANIDDGNLNYDTGQVSSAIKGTSELELRFRDSWGIFARGTAFYDDKAGDTNRTELSDSALTRVERGGRMLDYFLFVPFELGDRPSEFRVGRQVINWGESTFIQNGINVTNPFDVAQLRVPGAELREALLPQGMAYLSVSATPNLSFEGYYQYEWKRVRPEPAGTFFSANDFAVQGGTHVMLGFGDWADQGTDFRPLGGAFDPTFNFVPRGDTLPASDGGQFGLAMRYFADQFMGGMEFGFYYVRYHSRLPLLTGRTSDPAGFFNAVAVATAGQATAQGLASGLSFDAAVANGAALGRASANANGGTVTDTTLVDRATISANAFLAGGTAALSPLLGAFGADELGQNSRYDIFYPEDIDVWGFSWSGYLFNTGIALQGEISYKPDAPLQGDDIELLFAALSPLDPLLAPPGFACPTNPAAVGPLGCFGQFGPFSANQSVVNGVVELDVWQAQTTLTYLSGPMLGSDAGVFVMEVGMTYVPDLPNPNTGGPNGVGLRLDGPGTSISGNQALATRHFGEFDPRSAFPSKTSWGYRFRGSLVYNNAIGPWTLSPIVSWSQDVSGIAPGPGGNFREDRYAMSAGLKGTLRSKYELELTYAQFGGAGIYNTGRDRDFISFTAKVSF